MGTQYDRTTPLWSCAMFRMWVFMNRLEPKLV